jgi:hypothetical protein
MALPRGYSSAGQRVVNNTRFTCDTHYAEYIRVRLIADAPSSKAGQTPVTLRPLRTKLSTEEQYVNLVVLACDGKDASPLEVGVCTRDYISCSYKLWSVLDKTRQRATSLGKRSQTLDLKILVSVVRFSPGPPRSVSNKTPTHAGWRFCFQVRHPSRRPANAVTSIWNNCNYVR